MLARHTSRLGLVGGNWRVTESSGRAKPASGGVNPFTWCVAALAGMNELLSINGSIDASFGIVGHKALNLGHKRPRQRGKQER